MVEDPNPRQTAMQKRLDAMTEDERRVAVMAMSTSQKAVLNWGDSYGPRLTTPHAVFCAHANENPNQCTCPDDCYCRARTCQDKPVFRVLK